MTPPPPLAGMGSNVSQAKITAQIRALATPFKPAVGSTDTRPVSLLDLGYASGRGRDCADHAGGRPAANHRAKAEGPREGVGGLKQFQRGFAFHDLTSSPLRNRPPWTWIPVSAVGG